MRIAAAAIARRAMSAPAPPRRKRTAPRAPPMPTAATGFPASSSAWAPSRLGRAATQSGAPARVTGTAATSTATTAPALVCRPIATATATAVVQAAACRAGLSRCASALPAIRVTDPRPAPLRIASTAVAAPVPLRVDCVRRSPTAAAGRAAMPGRVCETVSGAGVGETPRETAALSPRPHAHSRSRRASPEKIPSRAQPGLGVVPDPCARSDQGSREARGTPPGAGPALEGDGGGFSGASFERAERACPARGPPLGERRRLRAGSPLTADCEAVPRPRAIFLSWCEDLGLKPLPAEPATVAAYLAARADAGPRC
jgi:hypothetical protein